MSYERSIPTQLERVLMIRKRDNRLETFNPKKIYEAAAKAYVEVGVWPDRSQIEELIRDITREAVSRHDVSGEKLGVEDIQDMVARGLMRMNPDVAQAFIEYRTRRTVARERNSELTRKKDEIVNVIPNDMNRSNANMSAATPSGQMMTCASEHFKTYALDYVIPEPYNTLHREGWIHIHDADYYPTKTSTCLQYDLKSLYEQGFRTKNGTVRPPKTIHSYATLATIVFQTNQNEQHGGQSIPAFDFFMAPGVRKSFDRTLSKYIHFTLKSLRLERESEQGDSWIRSQVTKWHLPFVLGEGTCARLHRHLQEVGIGLPLETVRVLLKQAYEETEQDTHQAMEGFIHNLNTMHSRGGNQVVFSSVNYGTDTSPEGRMVTRQLLICTKEGLGRGEVPIFPIQVFKVKSGVNYSESDMKLAMRDYARAERGELEFETPNFDLLLLASHTTAKALFPTFLFLDSTFNHDEAWRADDPERYMHEVATMGCRTRVYENLNGMRTSVGRGNLSFTSINFPRLAIESRRLVEAQEPQVSREEKQDMIRDLFLSKVREMAHHVAQQLWARFVFQGSAYAFQFPFMMRNNLWKGGGALQDNDKVLEVLRQGTLGIGFIGGHNAMVAIYDEGHARSARAWQTLYDAVRVLNEVADQYKQRYKLNYAVLATPAEGLAGRFTKLDVSRYGVLPCVNDRDYYVNSFHIDVREPISISRKIALEAPFHSITRGGHISYVELDGEAKKNTKSILRIVDLMFKSNIGYGAINHPVDTCSHCYYQGVIYDKCPKCGCDQISRTRRITGYLTGSVETWNQSKIAEERDRVKHFDGGGA